MKQFDQHTFFEALGKNRREFHANYYAMYSSAVGGIVTDPLLMLVPADDHIVHRGDGVFEAFKCMDGNIYNLDAHLSRLAVSAAALSLALPVSREEQVGIILETARAGARRDCLLRIMLSRGPGSFGVNPYDCPAAQLYVTATKLPAPFMISHPGGAKAISSAVPCKPPKLAVVKTCNYALNAMMQKEADDAGADFAISFDDRGFMAECSTENAGIVTAAAELAFPDPRAILQGTTMMRVAELARKLEADRTLKSVSFRDISRTELEGASEILITGTTRDVTAVVELDGKKIGFGQPGPVCKKLGLLLDHDMLENRALLTRAFP